MGFTMSHLEYDELICGITSYSTFNNNSERDLLYLLEQGFSLRAFSESHKHTVCKDSTHNYSVEQCDSCSQEKHLKITDFRKPKGKTTT